MQSRRLISIWFFIGVLISFYGILIFASGIYDWVNPEAHPVVLANLHAGVWWGIVLTALGVFYTIRFAPRRQK